MLQKENLDLKVQLSLANARSYDMGKIIEREKTNHKILMKRINIFQAAERKNKSNEEKAEKLRKLDTPADEEAPQDSKVDLNQYTYIPLANVTSKLEIAMTGANIHYTYILQLQFRNFKLQSPTEYNTRLG